MTLKTSSKDNNDNKDNEAINSLDELATNTLTVSYQITEGQLVKDIYNHVKLNRTNESSTLQVIALTYSYLKGIGLIK